MQPYTQCPLQLLYRFSTDKPTINATKLPKMIPVFSGYPEELICEADGNPPPRILWLQNSNDDLRVDKPTLTVYKAGNYSCSATNIVASVSHEVTVILKGKTTFTLNDTMRSSSHLSLYWMNGIQTR